MPHFTRLRGIKNVDRWQGCMLGASMVATPMLFAIVCLVFSCPRSKGWSHYQLSSFIQFCSLLLTAAFPDSFPSALWRCSTMLFMDLFLSWFSIKFPCTILCLSPSSYAFADICYVLTAFYLADLRPLTHASETDSRNRCHRPKFDARFWRRIHSADFWSWFLKCVSGALDYMSTEKKFSHRRCHQCDWVAWHHSTLLLCQWPAYHPVNNISTQSY